MVFEEDDISYCLSKARDIGDQYELYVLHGKEFPRSVDDLLWICGEYLGKKIFVEYVDIPAEGSSVSATYWANSDGSYRIGLLTGMSKDEEKFVLCKELFHVIFDDEGRRSMDLSTHLEDCTTAYTVNGGPPRCAVAWETLAEIAAIEFYFPFEQREKCLDGGTVVDFARLAVRFEIPRYYVEVACGAGNMAYVKKYL
ncbi:hypothetical protein CMZ84_04440 [Lysobacteraceae bacterium NML93-0399]|nr:hypothetical protein CMZ84_04440 [Xanthomonadaceae bacterium NML93-0399]